MENELLDNTTQEMEYIGDIPEGWKWVKLGDEIEIISGGTPKTNKLEYWNGNIPWLTIADFNNVNKYVDKAQKTITEIGLSESSTKLLKPGDIIISARGTIGAIAVVKKEMAFNQSCYGIRSKSNEIYQDFLYYLLKNSINMLLKNSYGAVFDTITRETFSLLFCPLPPLPEQKAIADVLSSIDDKIELLHRQNKTLEEMAMTLFRQWFIEPTKDGLPDGWEERKLKDIYIFEKGIEPGSKNYLETPIDDTVRFIRVGDMLDNKADVYIKKDLAGNSICNFEDLLVSFDGTVGRVSFGLVGCYSSGIRKIYSKDEIYNKLWLKHQIFISEEIQDEINMHAEGTTILHASSSIDYLSFVFPPKEKIEEYDKFFEPIYKKILHNKAQIQTFEKLRDTLLPKLMSGEIRVKIQ